MKKFILKLQLVESNMNVETKKFDIELNLGDCVLCAGEVLELGPAISKLFRSIDPVNSYENYSDFLAAQEKPLLLKIAPDYNTQGYVTHVHIEVLAGSRFEVRPK